MRDLTRIMDLTVVLSVFGLVLAVWMVFLLAVLFRRAKSDEKVERRLGLREAKSPNTRVLRLWHDGEENTTTVPEGKQKRSIWRSLDDLRRNAGWQTPLQTIVLGLLGVTTFAAVMILAITGSWPAALTTVVAIVLIFWIYLKQCVSRRTNLFERQFLEAIGLATRSLRAGHPLTGAFRLISEEIANPVGRTFEDICQQQALGASLEKAIRSVAALSNSPDMKMFATSVVMQLRSGGNLADMMERLAAVMRGRMRLHRRIRVLTAQTQLSKRVLLLLPIVVFALLNTMNKYYMEPLYTTRPGKLMLVIGAASLLLGAWLMGRIAKLDY